MVRYKHFDIRPGTKADFEQMSGLSADVLGPGRFARTAYRLRERSNLDSLIVFNAFDGETLVGTVTLTPLVIGGLEGAFLLGPLMVDEAHRGDDLGSFLINHCKHVLQKQGAELMILVGDLSYYKRTGFKQVPYGTMQFPGPIDYGRLLAIELSAGAMSSFCGEVKV